MNLPDKLSDLLELALNDLELCEQDDRYIIDMTVWHRPDGKQCSVCLAGSILAKTFKIRATIKTIPEAFDERNRLIAIDRARVGNIEDALQCLGIHESKMPKFLSFITMPDYNRQPEVFKSELRSLIQLLRGYDL